jgi:hypothetical protein
VRNAFSIANSNCDGDSNRDLYTDGHRNGDRDRDGHANYYRYGKTHSKSETPSHTKASSHPTASSVTGNTHDGLKAGRRKFNQ